jgi:hypothetical protein
MTNKPDALDAATETFLTSLIKAEQERGEDFALVVAQAMFSASAATLAAILGPETFCVMLDLVRKKFSGPLQ